MPYKPLRFFFSLIAVLVWTTVSSSPVQANPMTDIQQLADTGAVNLAVRVLDKEQSQTRHIKQWEKFERERVALYLARHDWRKLEQRLSQLPKNVTPGFTLWAKAQRAAALIQMQQGAAARAVLRQMIWAKPLHNAKQLAEWRQLIIRSYLTDGHAKDAQIAIMRFREDYPKQASHDYMMRARILLVNHNYHAAIHILEPHAKEPMAGALLLLTQLRGKSRPPKHVLEASFRHLREKGIDQVMTANLWAVAAEAAERAGDEGPAAAALEQALVYRQSINLPKSIIDPTGDDLWKAYRNYALAISNKRQLLIGQDKKWLALAAKLKKKKPVAARSLYAFIMLHSQSPKYRRQASVHFLEIMDARKHGNPLLQILFDNTKQFKQPSRIPPVIRPRLVDLALSQGNIDQASEIMATIKKPPKGQDQFMWWLRRARILVLGNQLKLGVQALDALLDANPKLKQLQIERFMQVLFDLQTADDNEAAYKLFIKLQSRCDDKKTRREIYYWMADSRKAQGRYIEAAQLYLKSALYPDPKSMDPWAQTARYQAAVVLAKAGLYQDAKTLLDRLLKVTKDPERRAALQRELQKMWAMQ